ncbi:hypothetical protein [Zhongshania marina]|uniref:Uncharacterized protein n=1 Tax=Zhongshania marina TaxID=2304603 RepID=A0A2S4HC60_9GAMM|nr:hypothetical protein [Marortus luteolus]POP51548.1 hypothetical protein C0068_16560 [Marortus luteolus]
MSSNTYTDFLVFTTGIRSEVNTQPIDLFSNGTEVVIVISQSHANNVDTSQETWSCDYIGPVSTMISDYVPKMAYFFDDGLARSNTIPNGTEFSKLMSKLYMVADPITLQDLASRGVRGYSWSIEEYQQAPVGADPIEYDYFSTKRMGYVFGGEEDVINMIQQSLIIRQKANNHVWAGRPWLAVSGDF